MLPVIFLPEAPCLHPAINDTRETEGLRELMRDISQPLASCDEIIVVARQTYANHRQHQPSSPQWWPHPLPEEAACLAAYRGHRTDPDTHLLPIGLALGAWVARMSDRPFKLLSIPPTDFAVLEAATLLDVHAGAGLLVMGDGPASGFPHSPGHERDGAVDFADMLLSVWENADVDGLEGIDSGEGERLWVSGWPAWKTAARAILTMDLPVRPGEVIHTSPFGVSYFFAQWFIADEAA